MNLIRKYFQRRRERKRELQRAKDELFALQLSRAIGAAFKIMAPAAEFYSALKDKSDEEKTAELRLKYLKGEIKK